VQYRSGSQTQGTAVFCPDDVGASERAEQLLDGRPSRCGTTADLSFGLIRPGPKSAPSTEGHSASGWRRAPSRHSASSASFAHSAANLSHVALLASVAAASTVAGTALRTGGAETFSMSGITPTM
jgi:hypothetical protein